MSETQFDDETWLTLLNKIKSHRCTPFLGAGASFPALPLGSTIAADWAREYNYPGDNPKNLLEVAEFLAIKFDLYYPREKILKQVARATPPDFNATDEPHGLLADLPLPLYLTTNYDDFMVQALKSRHRDAHRELFRWNKWVENQPSVFDTDFRLTVDHPVVFHLHGHTIPESLVLTESDYLVFIEDMHGENRLPLPINKQIATSICVFIGYRLADWNLRLLLMEFFRYSESGILVLKPPGDDELARRQRDYLNQYYAIEMQLKVYWGTAREFAFELRERWEKFCKA